MSGKTPGNFYKNWKMITILRKLSIPCIILLLVMSQNAVADELLIEIDKCLDSAPVSLTEMNALPGSVSCSGSEITAGSRLDERLTEAKILLGSLETGKDLADFVTIICDSDYVHIPVIQFLDKNSTLPAGFDKGLIAAILTADSLATLSLRGLSDTQRDSLESLLRAFAPEDDQWPHFPLERMLELMEMIDFGSMFSSVDYLVAALDLIIATDNETYPDTVTTIHSGRGNIVIGTVGNDSYELTEPLLLIDPGGDDSYRISHSKRSRASLIVDLAGDDTWAEADSFSLAGALMNVRMLCDLDGNDTYESGSYSLAGSLAGLAVLADFAGNDSYRGDSFCQGASSFGYALFLDSAGDDSCAAGFAAQGAQFASGYSLHADLGGNDIYKCGGLVRDWRAEGAYKSWTQGTSIGLRPFVPGGVAVHYDREGADSYEADYFSQGAAAWQGKGYLFDSAGNDSYAASRYSQGAAVHRAVGVLWDSSGDDSYRSDNFSQATADDRSIGVLVERAGDDSYVSNRASAGFAGSGAVALFADLEGIDSYDFGVRANVGFGSQYRELPGLGVFIDRVGPDNWTNGRDILSRENRGTFGWAVTDDK